MNICIITSSFSRGDDDSVNAGVFVRSFALALSKTEHNIFILTPKKYGTQEDPQLNVKFFKWLGGEASLTHLNPKHPIGAIKLASVVIGGIVEILSFVKENKIDLCLAMCAIPNGIYALIAKLFFKIPFVTWALGSDIWRADDYPFGKKIVKRVLLSSEKVYADGLVLAADVERISKRKCGFLPTSRKLNLDSSPKAQVDASKTNFLYIGRWHPHKGVDILIDAFHELIQEQNNTYLYIFGGGPLESLVRKKIESYHLENSVHLGGFASASQVVAYLKACDCLVIPSRIESIPVILSDAIQVDSPVIVTPVGDMAEVVNRFGIGLVADDATAPSIKKAMAGFKALTNRSQFRQGLQKAKNFFSVEKSVQQFLSDL